MEPDGRRHPLHRPRRDPRRAGRRRIPAGVLLVAAGSHPDFAPDGERLVNFLAAGSVSSSEGEMQQDCYVTTIDGMGVRLLEVQPSPCSRPAWQPLPEEDAPELTLDVEDLPDEVCDPGWAVQTDLTVGLRRADVPQTIDRATWTGVLGWGTVVKAARHHSLEYHLGDPVPACSPGSETAG